MALIYDSERSISKIVLSILGCDNTLIHSFTFEKQMAKICSNNSYVCLPCSYTVVINHLPIKCSLRFVLFVVTMLSMTLALNLAIDINEDPRMYRATAKDILRGSMEAITLICILCFTVSEISNIYTYVTLKTLLHCSLGILCILPFTDGDSTTSSSMLCLDSTMSMLSLVLPYTASYPSVCSTSPLSGCLHH